jgi:hypothetical protein
MPHGIHVGRSREDSFGDGHGKYGVVGEHAAPVKKREVLDFDRVVFIHRPDDVAGNGSDDGCCLLR